MDKLKYYIITMTLLVSLLLACTDKKAEEQIKGNWHASTMIDNGTGKTHELPEGITFEFEYPRYSFEGDIIEKGKFYIKDDHLYLLTESGEPLRRIAIQDLTQDTLTLSLQDSSEIRTVKFFRQ